MNYCPSCGKSLQSEMTECPNCSQPLAQNAVTMPQQQRQSIFWPIVGALLFVFVGLPIIFMVLFAGCAGCAAFL